MEMFLMVAALSLLGVAVSAALFAAATRQERAEEQKVPLQAPALVPPQFFADAHASAAPRVPIEAILLEIERHVQLEQAAAESFLHAPTVELLHSRTMSRMVH